jgi:UDP-glucuronate 4-epimerase
MKVILTGAAGFIGFHVGTRLLERGDEVVGIDSLSDYYDVSLKEARLSRLLTHPNFSFHKIDIANRESIAEVFDEQKPERVINLAAQAGVRYSIENPHTYVDANLVGFVNILEGCRRNAVEHLVYASSSSVYGSNKTLPFSVTHSVDHPVSLYAATKKSNELMAHTYSHLYRLPTTGLRFFTVYGPWGRPDMAYFLFTKAILEERPIDIYNSGRMRRDFTYIDDIVEGVLRTLDKIPAPDPDYSSEHPTPESSSAPYRVYNIGNHQSVELLYFIELIENGLGKKATKNMLPLQPGDVEETCADVEALIRDVGFSPDTPIEIGVTRFLEWYCDYYREPRPPFRRKGP